MSIKSSTLLETSLGVFRASYHDVGGTMIVSFVCDDKKYKTPILRMHSGCMFGDAFHSLHCPCGAEKDAALQAIKQHGHGVFVYSPAQEGRGYGLEIKIKEMAIQREMGVDSIDALKLMELEPDIRTYEKEIEVLKELETPKTIIHFSGNPNKTAALKAGGFVIAETIECTEGLAHLAAQERRMKQARLGYSYPDNQ